MSIDLTSLGLDGITTTLAIPATVDLMNQAYAAVNPHHVITGSDLQGDAPKRQLWTAIRVIAV